MSTNNLGLVVTVNAKQANAELAGVNRGLSGIERQAVQSAGRASRSVDGMTASMTKGVLAGNALYDMAKRAFGMLKQFTLGALEHADQMGKMSQRYGVSVKDLTAYGYAAKLADVDSASLGTSLKKLSVGMLDAASGSKENRRYFQQLRVEYQNTDKSLRPVGSVLEDIADRFKALPDGAAKTALAVKLLGRSGSDMIPMLNAGGASLRSMADEGRKLGVVFDAQLAKDAEIVNDNIARLKSSMDGLALNVARQLLPNLIELSDKTVAWVKDGGMQKAAAMLRNVAEWAKNLGLWIAAYAVVSQVIKLTSAIRALAVAQGALSVAALANPWGLAAAGLSAFGVILWNEHQKNLQFVKGLEAANKQAAILAEFRSGKTLGQVQKSGYSDAEIKYAMTGGQQMPEFGADRFSRVRGLGQDISSASTGEPGIAGDEADRIAKFIRDANRAARQFRDQAVESLVSGASREIMQTAREMEKLTTYVDSEGVEKKIKLSAQARSDMERALQIKIQTLQSETAKKAAKEYEDNAVRAMELAAQHYQKRTDFEKDLARQQYDNARQVKEFQLERAQVTRDAEMRKAELQYSGGFDADPRRQTGNQIALESSKADIEIQYIRQVHAVKTQLFDAETNQIILQLNLQKEVLAQAGVDTSRISSMISDLKAQREALKGQIGEQEKAAVDAVRENAQLRQIEMVRDKQREMWQSFKGQAEGIIDALTSRTGNMLTTIGNMLKSAILTPIKEIASTLIARNMMRMFGGGNFGGAQAAGQGGSGWAGALGGFAPMMMGGSGGGMGGYPGTPSFMPSAGGYSGAGGGGGIGGMNFGGGLSNLKQFLGITPNVPGGFEGPMQSFGQLGLGGKLSQLGKSNAALMGGATLAMMGLQRGGLSGLGMTAAGGALIGFKYGGGLGAAIGGAIGAGAGLVRMFMKSAEDKVKEKVKSTYGVSIGDKKVLTQIVQMAKSSFGGNLDMAVKSQQVADLVRLYALTYGQSTGKLPQVMTPGSLSQEGGVIRQNRSYYNGQLQPSTGGGIPGYASGINFVPKNQLAFLHFGERVLNARENFSFSRMEDFFGRLFSSMDSMSFGGGRLAPASGPSFLRLDGEATVNLLRGEAVNTMNRNPRIVQGASTRAMRSNYNRRESLALQVAPGLLTS